MMKYLFVAVALFLAEGPTGPNTIPPSVPGANGPVYDK